MTAAVRTEPAKPCPVCSGDPHARFAVTPWGFHDQRLVRCPLCLAGGASCLEWRDVLAPFLEARTA